MTEPADARSPAAALQAAFTRIQQRQMQDMPMLNPALQVEALGFVPWGEHWLGVLVTPWFMNLVLMPRVAARWHPLAEGASRHHVFPAGVFEFIGAHDAALGNYQACSLFSPMFEFASHAAARETAHAALAALLDSASRETNEVTAHTAAGALGAAATPVASEPTGSQAAPRAVSKRDFLFGAVPPAGRGP